MNLFWPFMTVISLILIATGVVHLWKKLWTPGGVYFGIGMFILAISVLVYAWTNFYIY